MLVNKYDALKKKEKSQYQLCQHFSITWHCSNYKLKCQAYDVGLRLVFNDDDDYDYDYDYYDDADENDMEMG